MWNERLSGIPLLRHVVEQLRGILPQRWVVTEEEQTGQEIASGALVRITEPGGKSALIVVELRQRVEPRDVPAIAEQLTATGESNFLFISPFVSERTKKMLEERGIGYADSTGNLRLTLSSPAVFVERLGAENDPWRESHPIYSLKGPAAARVVRALCDFRPPYTVGELAVRARTPASSVSRVLDLLDREALVTRGARGSVAEVQWNELIHRWIQDYSPMDANRVGSFLEPRGMMPLNQRLQAANWRYAVTGEQAAVHRVPLTVVRLGTIYVDAIESTAERLELRRVDTGANVLLLEPFDPVVYERTWSESYNVKYCALSQVAADMFGLPGRAPAEAEELLGWMGENENEWRN